MDESKSLLTKLCETIDQHRAEKQRAQAQKIRSQPNRLHRLLRWLMPNGGTLLLIIILLLTQNVWARPAASPAAPGPSATTVNYQGRLADAGGMPLDGTYGMTFSLWDAATDGNLIWGPENHAAVPVSDGLFSVGLGSQTAGGIPTTTWNGDRYLEIAVGGETLSPRELIRSVPVAGMALTVPDASVTTAKLAPNTVGQWTLPNNSESIALHSGASFDWQVVDVSTFVPATAEVVYVKLWLKETGGNGWCSVRPYGSTSSAGISIHTPVANKYMSGATMIALNDGKIEWKCQAPSGANVSDAGIALWGYYEPGH